MCQNVDPMQNSTLILHTIPGYISNLFLVQHPGEGLLLLDCGAPGDVERISQYCHRELGTSISDIRLAVVSHMHPDHAGAAYILRNRYGIPIAAHKRADRWYRGLGGMFQHRLDSTMMQFVAKSQGRRLENNRYPRILHPDYNLKDLDFLPLFPSWQVISAPGHTLHDIALYNKKEKLLYVGDCIVMVEGEVRLPLPVLFPHLMRESLLRLASLDFSTLLLAHGQVVKKEEARQVLHKAIKLLDEPPNAVMRSVFWLSVHPLEVKKEYWRRKKNSQKR